YERFDYDVAACLRFHEAVDAHIVPLVARLNRERQALLGVEMLRPWDLEVDPQGRPPLQPFVTAGDLVTCAAEVFARVDGQFGDCFRFLQARGLLDLENRRGKAPGAYHEDLPDRRWLFVFMNAVGLDRDVRVLTHEAGHAFHSLAAREEPLLDYRHPPVEFAEVAAMAMELLTLPHVDVFYPSSADRRRVHRMRLEGIARFLPWIATVDRFQQWLYTHPGHTREARRAAWLRTYRRFQKNRHRLTHVW
ncbi:MAG: M3 family oligoendopeptidase, partial [Armatimonadetes bacterium]|nr:M3 family oligoendopeptidase [Armatimonadota bacterium]